VTSSVRDTTHIKAFCKKSLSSGSGGIKFVLKNTVDSTTTVCIIPADKNNEAEASQRTIKAVRCSLLGIPMVEPTWIKACAKEENVVIPTHFIRSLPANVTKSEDGIAKHAAVYWYNAKAENGAPKLFHNTDVFLFGTYPDGRKEILIKLLKDGSANILPTSIDVYIQLEAIIESMINPELYSADCKRLVVLCGTGSETTVATKLQLDLEYALKHTEANNYVYVVDHNWVSLSITCAEMLAPENFKPASSALFDTWNFSRKMKQNV
jgi:hypothetical protein